MMGIWMGILICYHVWIESGGSLTFLLVTWAAKIFAGFSNIVVTNIVALLCSPLGCFPGYWSKPSGSLGHVSEYLCSTVNCDVHVCS